ncbi:hypothetical protein ACEPAI_6666 [Sanghuangporus weigelae]
MTSKTFDATRTALAGAVVSMFVIGALSGSMYARAQITSTTVTEVPLSGITPVVSITSAPAPTTTSTTSYGTMTVQCWRTTMLGGSSARFDIDTAAASTVSGAVCWEVFPLNGGIVSIPVTPGPDFQPLSLQSSLSAAAAATADSDTGTTSSPSSSSSNNLAKILPAALIGSLVGVVLLILTTVYILRLRQRRKSQDSRARRWVERNSTALRESWAMKETPAGLNPNANVGKVETA